MGGSCRPRGGDTALSEDDQVSVTAPSFSNELRLRERKVGLYDCCLRQRKRGRWEGEEVGGECARGETQTQRVCSTFVVWARASE